MRIGGMRPEEARVHDTWAGYHCFHAEETREEYRSFEIFFHDGKSALYYEQDDPVSDPVAPIGAGWYWWAAFPGCLPDGEPSGPFATSRDALQDADEWHPEFDEPEPDEPDTDDSLPLCECGEPTCRGGCRVESEIVSPVQMESGRFAAVVSLKDRLSVIGSEETVRVVLAKHSPGSIMPDAWPVREPYNMVTRQGRERRIG
jgi:hypothetical protein